MMTTKNCCLLYPYSRLWLSIPYLDGYLVYAQFDHMWVEVSSAPWLPSGTSTWKPGTSISRSSLGLTLMIWQVTFITADTGGRVASSTWESLTLHSSTLSWLTSWRVTPSPSLIKEPNNFFRRQIPPRSLAIDKHRILAAITKDMQHGALRPVNIAREGIPHYACLATLCKRLGKAMTRHGLFITLEESTSAFVKKREMWARVAP